MIVVNSSEDGSARAEKGVRRTATFAEMAGTMGSGTF
jgi:hypothetical protein